MNLLLIATVYTILILMWLVCFFYLLFMTYGIIAIEVPFVPVPRRVVEAIKKAMPLKEGDVLYDLGSGDGRVIAALAQSYPGAHTIGVERGPLPYLLTRLRFFFHPLPNAKTLFRNFSSVSLNDATHVYLYLFPKVVQNLLPKFERELKPGTRVVSCDFPFKTKEPVEQIVIGTGRNAHTLYVYEF